MGINWNAAGAAYMNSPDPVTGAVNAAVSMLPDGKSDQSNLQKHRLELMVRDANKAGIHPLYALGAGSANYSPILKSDPIIPTTIGRLNSGGAVAREAASSVGIRNSLDEDRARRAGEQAIATDHAQQMYYEALADEVRNKPHQGPTDLHLGQPSTNTPSTALPSQTYYTMPGGVKVPLASREIQQDLLAGPAVSGGNMIMAGYNNIGEWVSGLLSEALSSVFHSRGARVIGPRYQYKELQ